MASGIGASLSTALFGLVAVSLGHTGVFLSIASVGLLAAFTLWFLMPETNTFDELEKGHGKPYHQEAPSKESTDPLTE